MFFVPVAQACRGVPTRTRQFGQGAATGNQLLFLVGGATSLAARQIRLATP